MANIVPRRAFWVFLILASLISSLAFGQRGKIIKTATTSIMDPNLDGFISKTTAGFSNDGYNVDEFEIPMFGIPIYGSGEALADNQAGAKCGITDITVDSKGYGVYGVIDNSDNLIFRFRIGTDNPSVEAYTILIDTDGKMGADDPNATANNPGFEIDITLIKNKNKGVYIFNIDGIESCPVALRNYSFNSNFQISIADLVTCSNPDYFYDYFVPFSDLAALFGLTKDTGLRFFAVTNVSATCAMAGKISDVNGVDDTLYNGCNSCAFLDLSSNQCPTSLNNLCATCIGFQSGVTPKPTIDQPVKAGENFISGTLIDPSGTPLIGASIFIQIFDAAKALVERDTTLTNSNGLWVATLHNVLAAKDSVTARGQAIGRCSSAGLGSQASFTIVVTNVPPQLTGITTTLSYTENGVPLPIQPSLGIIDPDNAVLTSATVSIVSNFRSDQDALSFTAAAGITGSFNNSTGVLSLSGKASLAAYQSTLRSISYSNSSENPDPATRLIRFSVFDGLDNSNLLDRPLAVVPVNDPPVVTGSQAQIQYSIGNLVVDNTINIADVDNTLITGATVSISNNFFTTEDRLNFTNQLGISGSYNAATGVLTLTGTATLANYSTALQSISYTNLLIIPTILTRTVSFVVSDGTDNSASFNKFIEVLKINHPPIFVDGSNNPITVIPFSTPEDILLNACVLISDPDGDPVTIGSVNLVLGSGTFSQINGLCFRFTPAPDFNGMVTATITICDPSNSCGTGTLQITVSPVNDPPVIAGSTAPATYSGGNLTIDNTLLVSDVDSPLISGGTISITGDFVSTEDVLSFTNQLGITGAYNASTGVLVLSGSSSPANYSTAMASVVYSNAVLSSLLTRKISFQASDGSATSQPFDKFIQFSGNINRPPFLVDGSNNPVSTLNYSVNEDTQLITCVTAKDPDGDPISITSLVLTSGSGTIVSTGGLCFDFNPNGNFNGMVTASVTICDPGNACATGTIQINVIPVNDPPSVTGTSTVTQYVSGSVVIDNTLLTSDADDLQLAGATISISNNFVSGEDQLNFTNQLGILGNYNPATGLLTLTGVSSLSNYSAALSTITYSNSQQFPTTLTRKISFVVNDGTTNSIPFEKFVQVNQINVPPVLTDGTNPVDTVYYTILEDTPLHTCVNASDLNGDQVTISSLTLVSGAGSFAAPSGLCFDFLPATNFNGVVKGKIILCDKAVNSLCVVGGVVITVLPVDDPPVLTSLNFQVNEEATTPLCLTAMDIENDAAYFAAGLSLNGNAVITTGAVANDLCLLYTPNAGFTGVDMVNVTLCEINSPSVCSTTPMAITVNKINHPPVVLVNSVPGATINLTTAEDQPVSFCFEVVDPDGDNVTLQQTKNVAGGGTLTNYLGIEFCFTFTPKKDFNGTAVWTINVCDDGIPSLCGLLTANIIVTPVNDPPNAVNDTVTVIRHTVNKIDLLANDSDVEGDSIILNLTPITLPEHGQVTLSKDGMATYTSDRYYKGPDQMVYEECDNGTPKGCSRATVFFDVVDLPLRIYEGLSPNGDGKNEYWRIEGIDFYTDNVVRVFDRYNNLVFESYNYNNEDHVWRGEANHGLFRGWLPDGVYFYSIDLGTGASALRGFIIIKKE